MAASTQTPVSATTGNSVLVLPLDPLRRYMAIQIYTTSAGFAFIAFNRAATAGLNGEWQVSIGGVIIWGQIPPAVISNDTTYSGAAPPQGSVNIIGATGTATGCILTISG